MDAHHTILPIGEARCASVSCSVCAALSAGTRLELARLARTRKYRAGETVLAESGEISFVGNVVSGVLRMQKTFPDGRQQIVGLLLPSDMFGRVYTDTSPVAIEAATDTVLCCYNRTSFEALLERCLELEHQVLISVSHELDAAHDWMLLLATQTVTERVATFLLILRKKNPRPSGCEFRNGAIVSVPIARKDMAAYLGTTVESLSRSIQHMARCGIVRIIDAQRLEVVNQRRLLAISGHGPEDFEPSSMQLRRAG